MYKIDIPNYNYPNGWEPNGKSVIGNKITKESFENYMDLMFGVNMATVVNSKDDGTLFFIVYNNELYRFRYHYSTFLHFYNNDLLDYCISHIQEFFSKISKGNIYVG